MIKAASPMRRDRGPSGAAQARRTDHRNDPGAGSTHCVDGMATAEVCRRHGLSPATFYRFKAKYGGMDVSDAQRLKALEDENGKLKRLLADAMLDNIVLKDLLGSKPWDATGLRTMAEP
jgi:putative transposase